MYYESKLKIDPNSLRAYDPKHPGDYKHEERVILGQFLYGHYHGCKAYDSFSVDYPHPFPEWPAKSLARNHLRAMGYENLQTITLPKNLVHARNKWGEEEWHVYEKKTAEQMRGLSGTFGLIYKLDGILKPKFDPGHGNFSVTFIPKDKHQLCSKIQDPFKTRNEITKKIEVEPSDQFEARVKNEANLLQRDPAFHCYQPVFFKKRYLSKSATGENQETLLDSSAIVMRLLPGENLHDLCTRIRANELKLSLRDYLKLCIAILRDAERLHLSKVVHRDLKLDNVMIDLPRLRAKIIDVGQGIDADAEDDMRRGVERYSPPERFAGKKLDAKSDAYHLAWILHLLLGGSDSILSKPGDDFSVIGLVPGLWPFLPDPETPTSHHFADYAPFALVPGLWPSARKSIIEAFNGLTDIDTEKRFSETDALPYFENVLLQHDKNELVKTHPEVVPAYEQGFKQGIQLRNQLLQLSRDPLVTFDLNVDALKHTLLDAINKLPDHPVGREYALQAFIEQSECECFKDAKNKADLINKVETVLSQYIEQFKKLNALFLEMQTQAHDLVIQKINPEEMNLDYERERERDLYKLNKLIRRLHMLVLRETHLPFTLDNIALMQRKYEKYSQKYATKLDTMALGFMIENPSPTLDAIGLFAMHTFPRTDVAIPQPVVNSP